MNSLISLFAMALIACAPFGCAEDLSQLPEMAPERCAELPPKEMYERFTSVEHRVPQVGASLGGQDYFCAVYQQQLQKFTDARYPRAREYRKSLTDAFLALVSYVEQIYHHDMVKHLRERTVAEIEWTILQAEKKDYQLWRETNYNAVSIEKLGLMMAEANGTGIDFENRALPFLHEALRQFVVATTDKDGEVVRKRKAFFGHAMVKFLTDLI